jgi:hypothetical protein
MNLVVDLSATILKKSDAKGRAYRAFFAPSSFNNDVAYFGCKCRSMKRNAVLDRPLDSAGFDDLSIADLFNYAQF